MFCKQMFEKLFLFLFDRFNFLKDLNETVYDIRFYFLKDLNETVNDMCEIYVIDLDYYI